jgi:two-component system, sensor histidine kinase PdtaS
MALTCFGQPSFETLRKDLEQKMIHCHFKEALNLINKNSGLYHDSAKIELDIMKMKILTELGLYDEAFKLSQNLVANSKTVAEQKLKIHVERALIFEINNDYSSCVKELKKAENLISKYPQLKFKNYTNFLIRKSSYYRVSGSSDKAYRLALQAEKYAMTVHDTVNMPVVQLILGLGNRRTNPEKELKHYQRALYLYKKQRHYEAVISMYTNISFFYLQKKQYESATLYIDSALAIVSKSNVLSYKADVYQTKSTILEQEKKTDSALYYFKTAAEYYKKSNSEQRDIKIKELEAQYNFEKEKAEKQSLKKDIKNTRILNTTLIVSLLILALFIRQMMKNKRKIENQKKKISENNTALTTSLEEKQFLVQELNHRVKNNLAVILSLIDFQKDQEKNEDYKNRFDDLYQRIKTIMIAHELYSYSVNYNDHALIEARNYLDKIFETHQNSSMRTFIYINDAEASYFTVDKILSLGLLVNELVTNSIKHAKPSKELVLHLELKKTDKNEIEVYYSDNGTVFNFEKNNDSLGLVIIEGMVKQLKGTYSREKADYKIVFPND